MAMNFALVALFFNRKEFSLLETVFKLKLVCGIFGKDQALTWIKRKKKQTLNKSIQ